MSLSRSCVTSWKRSNTIVLPIRSAFALNSQRSYSSRSPADEASKSGAEIQEASNDSSEKTRTKQTKNESFIEKVRNTYARRDEILAGKPSSKPKPAESNSLGQLARGSIFDQEIQSQAKEEDPSLKLKGDKSDPSKRNAESIEAFLNPRPHATQRWLRKVVARRVRRHGLLTKEEVRKRTERELRTTSEFWKTSIKKLAPLARQISGKTVDEALVQMRFSKKMPARKIYEFLVESRNRAVIERGMGMSSENALEEPIGVRLKNGRRKEVADSTQIYIAQAWVGQGSYGKSMEWRARGRLNIRRNPTTSISVLLKEEKTRIREHNDRTEKQLAAKPWIQMPNRPITAQRQYYSW